MTLDLHARYSVDGYNGIAFYLLGYAEEEREIETTEEHDGETYIWIDYETVTNTDMVRAVMVGDDRVHIIDVDDLTKLEDDAYCSCCGQIGCPW